ncbi:MAG: MBL fold metallo-hydrolase, partial [Gammaproteobacteria bacterium]
RSEREAGLMEFAVAGSGSRGNATVIRAGSTTVMVDCGFTFSEIKRRIERLSLTVDDLDAMLVTHEHGDHISGIARLAARADIPVYASAGTARAAEQRRQFEGAMTFDSHAPFAIGDLEITPIIVPHDAAEPTQFVLSDGVRRLAIMTDIGHVTPFVIGSLGGLDGLIVESNHDVGMLAAGPYPEALKRRVGGSYGHLSNEQTGELLCTLELSNLHTLALAHLSEKNNRPEIAREAAARALDCESDWVRIADQDAGLPWQTL